MQNNINSNLEEISNTPIVTSDFELSTGTFIISGILSKSNWTQRILVYQLPLGIDTSGYNISCSQLGVSINQNQYDAEIYQCIFQHGSIWVTTLDPNVEGCYAFAKITITKK